MKLFYAQFSWYDEYDDDEDKEQHAIIPGIDYSDAVKALESQYTHISEINFKEIAYDCGDDPVIYLPNNEEVINAVIEENNY